MVIIKRTETYIEHDILVGGVKIGEVELCPERNEISRLVIYEPYQCRGHGTEVVKRLVEWGYTSLGVHSNNLRAIHVYEKCGFVPSGAYMFDMKYQQKCGSATIEEESQ